MGTTDNYGFVKHHFGYPVRDDELGDNLDLIDAAIKAREDETDASDALVDGKIIVGNGSDVATDVAMSGDITIINTGATTIGADKVTNTKLANITRGSVKVGGASDAPTDLTAKTDAQMLIGDGTDITSVALTGDVTIINTGETSIGADKVTKVEIAADVAGDGLTQAAGGELDVNVDDSTIEVATDVVQVKNAGITIGKLEAALLKDLNTFAMSFETSEQTTTKIYFPMKVTINKIRSIVMKELGGTDTGTISGANSVGVSADGVVTVAISAALNEEDSASPSTNIEVAAGSYYQLTTAKTTAGGKVLITLEYTRAA